MQHQHPPRLSAKRAFTIIELLVVISIISLLVAILLPALSSARTSAHSVGCLSNLRQVGMAFEMYATDHNRLIPGWRTWGRSNEYDPRDEHYNNRYERALDPYLGAEQSPESEHRAKANSPVWVCPLRLSRGRASFSGSPGPGGFRGSDYTTNRYLDEFVDTDAIRTDHRAPQVGATSDRMVVGCGKDIDLRATMPHWNERIYWQHTGDTGSFLMLDWSARMMAGADTPVFRDRFYAEHPAGGGHVGPGYATFWVWTQHNVW